MRIRVLRNLGADLPSFKEGQVCDVEEEQGLALIERGLAEEMVAPKAKIKAVPKMEIKSQESVVRGQGSGNAAGEALDR